MSASPGTERLIGPERLAELLAAGACMPFDCRFELSQPQAGRAAWLESRIPGAAYAHLDDDLSAPVTPSSGRHPLPSPAAFADFLARWGWRPGLRIVAYDAQGNAMASRLWWLMRYFGHDCVSLLDGGFGAWRAAGQPLESGPAQPRAAEPTELRPRRDMVLDAAALQSGLEDGSVLLLDARAADRFAGRNETLDTVAGHVPGALNAPFGANLEEGRFRSPETLRDRFASLGAAAAPDRVVHMCGSGVTACHNLFAMEQAGLSGSRLYPGSWSEWIRDPNRPVAVGAD